MLSAYFAINVRCNYNKIEALGYLVTETMYFKLHQYKHNTTNNLHSLLSSNIGYSHYPAYRKKIVSHCYSVSVRVREIGRMRPRFAISNIQ